MVLTARPTALWVLPVGALGGVGRHAVDVASVGVPGWDLAFLAPEGPVVDALEAHGAQVHVDRLGPDHGLPASLAAFRRTTRRVRPQLVHTHLSYADVVGAIATSRGVPLVTTEHGIADDDLVYHGSAVRSRAKARLHHTRLHRASALVAVSDATLRVARTKWRVPARLPAHVIRNGVDVPAPEPAAVAGLHVVSLARLAPEKGLAELVAGFDVLAREHRDARLTLAGVGPLEADLRAQVATLGLGDRVDLPGFVDAGELLGRAHVLAQLSVWENCSYSLLDAVARSVGVVASPVGGNPEILPPRCLVDPEDPRAVARVLAEQGLQPELRPRLDPGWPDLATMTKQLAEVYAEVSVPRGRRR